MAAAHDGTHAHAETTPIKAHYLDSAIMCYPNAIGAPDSMILVGGKEGPLKGAEPFLEVLGGDLRYLGENIASAATLDLALLSTSVALYLGVAHSAHICESEGVGVDLLASVASRKVKDCDLRDEAPTIPETAV